MRANQRESPELPAIYVWSAPRLYGNEQSVFMRSCLAADLASLQAR